MFQGRDIQTPLEQLDFLQEFAKIYKEAEPRIYPKKVEKGQKANAILLDDSSSERKIQRVDECLNFLKLRHHLLQRGYRSFELKFASPSFFAMGLPERKVFLGAASEYHMCKCIIMENKKFKPEMASEFYQKYVCVVIQFKTNLNNEKLIKAMKNYQNSNCAEKVSRKGFHYRLAPDTVNAELSGYMHNAVTPFMFKNTEVPMVVSDRIQRLKPGFFWLGGGHVNTKISRFIRFVWPVIFRV